MTKREVEIMERAYKKVLEQKRCQKPDRDEPKLKCGYPLPCPYHDKIH